MSDSGRVSGLYLRIVQVASGAGGGRWEKLATGFALSPTRILTCAHALVDGGEHQVRFLETKQGRDRWIPVKAVLFNGWDGGANEPGRDVAVLEVDAEAVKQGVASEMLPVLSSRRSGMHEPWWSRGALHAAQEKDAAGSPVSKIVGFRGTLDAPDSGNTISLEVNAPPREAEGWQGGSGSPVFVDEALVGVVSDWPKNWDGKVLHAAWLGGLREDGAFVAAVALSSTQQAFEALFVRIRELLDQPESASLIPVLRACSGEPTGQAATSGAVTAWLLGMGATQLVALTNHAYNALMAPELIEKGKEQPAVARQLFRLADLLLTAILDRVTLDNLARQDGAFTLVQAQGVGPESVLGLPCQALSVAELYMARLDGRPPEHQLEPELEDDPPGVLSVPFPPLATEFKPEIEAKIFEHLASACHLPRTRRVKGAHTSLAPLINKALATYANATLSADAAKRWYLLFFEDSLREEMLKLKKLLPELRICQLGCGMTEAAEFEEIEFCMVLYQYFERKRRFNDSREQRARQGKGS